MPKTRFPIKDGETLAGRQSLAHQVSAARTFVLQQGQAYYNQGRADNNHLPIRLTFIVMWGSVLQPGIPTNISEFLATAKQGKNVLIVLLCFLFFCFIFLTPNLFILLSPTDNTQVASNHGFCRPF